MQTEIFTFTAIIEIVFYGAKFEIKHISHYLYLAELILDMNAQVK